MNTRRALCAMSGVLVVLALGVAAAFVTSAKASSHAVTPTTFTDASGDASAGAPDIITATVGDDLASGAISFGATATGYSTIDGAQFPQIDIYVDVDQNAATGSTTSGSEYDLAAFRDQSGFYWGLGHWNGSKWESVALPGDLVYARSGDTVMFVLTKGDIGVTGKGVRFHVASSTWDASGNAVGFDRAPDGGSWSYALSTPSPATTTTTTTPAAVVKPVIGAPTIKPRAVAGMHVTVTFPVTRSDNGQPLTSGKMICDPSVQGRVITHAESFAGGTARLAFTIPKSAKGKLLKVKVTIKAGSQAVTRVATFKVR